MGAPPKADWREERRKRAWALKQEGWPQQEIARALGVSAGAVSQWLKRAREAGGVEGLKRRPPPGMVPRLSAEQRAQLPALLVRGAEAYGFRGDVWTARRVAQLIAETFGVHYHRDHVSRVLRQLGGVGSDPSRGRPSATSRPSRNGSKSAGRPFEKSGRGRGDYRLGR